MAAPQHLLCTVAALGALLALGVPPVLGDASCFSLCTASDIPTPDATCTADCTGCLASVSKGCNNYFFPMWSTDTLDAYDGSIPSPAYQRGYTGNYCMRVCPLAWWQWLLVSIAALLLLLSVGWCCYSCARRKRKGAEVALSSFDGQVPDPNYPPPAYSDTLAYPQSVYSANVYPSAVSSSAPGPSHYGK